MCKPTDFATDTRVAAELRDATQLCRVLVKSRRQDTTASLSLSLSLVRRRVRRRRGTLNTPNIPFRDFHKGLSQGAAMVRSCGARPSQPGTRRTRRRRGAASRTPSRADRRIQKDTRLCERCKSVGFLRMVETRPGRTFSVFERIRIKVRAISQHFPTSRSANARPSMVVRGTRARARGAPLRTYWDVCRLSSVVCRP